VIRNQLFNDLLDFKNYHYKLLLVASKNPMVLFSENDIFNDIEGFLFEYYRDTNPVLIFIINIIMPLYSKYLLKKYIENMYSRNIVFMEVTYNYITKNIDRVEIPLEEILKYLKNY
jgi:hypothetical protein